MEKNRQKQKAGDNSHQYIVGNVNITNGLTEERTREIYRETRNMEIANYAKEAIESLTRRLDRFEDILYYRLRSIAEPYNNFADPYFLFLLKDTQRVAATTEEDNDYKLLTELLICHIEKGENTNTKSSIKKAIDIVGMIDISDLCALTVAHAVNRLVPESGICFEGLKRLDELFSTIMYCELPKGNSWIENLEMVGAVSISPLGSLIKTKEIYREKLNGYTCVGIKKGSKEYKKAISLLKNVGINTDILVNHELLDGYVRIGVSKKDSIEKLYHQSNIGKTISDKEVECLYQVWDLYSEDTDLQRKVNKKFDDMWNSFGNLKKVSIWWDSIPEVFRITKVGYTLAHINAKRCDSSLPDLV